MSIFYSHPHSYMPHDCLLLPPFPMDGQLAFAFEVHLTLFLLWTRLRQGLPTLFFFICLFVWSKDFKDNQGCQVFSAMTGLDISTVPTQQFVAVCVGARKPVRNGIILHACAYSCHLTRLVSGSDFCQIICLSSCRTADSIWRMWAEWDDGFYSQAAGLVQESAACFPWGSGWAAIFSIVRGITRKIKRRRS